MTRAVPCSLKLKPWAPWVDEAAYMQKGQSAAEYRSGRTPLGRSVLREVDSHLGGKVKKSKNKVFPRRMIKTQAQYLAETASPERKRKTAELLALQTESPAAKTQYKRLKWNQNQAHQP